jgi:hypothetical protein
MYMLWRRLKSIPHPLLKRMLIIGVMLPPIAALARYDASRPRSGFSPGPSAEALKADTLKVYRRRPPAVKKATARATPAGRSLLDPRCRRIETP